jgi:hypothetical protein
MLVQQQVLLQVVILLVPRLVVLLGVLLAECVEQLLALRLER